jgi:hypothetical protein
MSALPSEADISFASCGGPIFIPQQPTESGIFGRDREKERQPRKHKFRFLWGRRHATGGLSQAWRWLRGHSKLSLAFPALSDGQHERRGPTVRL